MNDNNKNIPTTVELLQQTEAQLQQLLRQSMNSIQLILQRASLKSPQLSSRLPDSITPVINNPTLDTKSDTTVPLSTKDITFNIHDDSSVATTDINIIAKSIEESIITYNTIDSSNDSNNNSKDDIVYMNNQYFHLVHKVIAMINGTTMCSIMAKITSKQMLGNYITNPTPF